MEAEMLQRIFFFGLVRAPLVAGWLLAVGCTAQNPAQVVEPGQSLTYYQDVAPILGQECVGCHSEGGIAPFALTNYADVKSHAAEIAAAVELGRMPPLPPDTSNCAPLDDERTMAQADKEALIAWARGGQEEGDAATAAPVNTPSPILGAPAMTVDSGIDYDSDFAGSDEYRCFVIDPKLTGSFPLIAAGTTSTNNAIVHHVIVDAVLPAQVAAVKAKDAADPKPGYECFGGVGVAGTFSISASAVGSQPRPFPDG